MRDFLEKQQKKDSKPVLDFCFATASYETVCKHSGGNCVGTTVRDVTNFSSNSAASFQAIPEDFFEVTGTDFFLYNDVQGGVDIDEIGGKPNAIQLLYT